MASRRVSAVSGGKISKTILLAGRIGGVAFERVMQCPHPAAAHIQVKEQIEFAVGGLIAPDRGWRLLASLHSVPLSEEPPSPERGGMNQLARMERKRNAGS